MVRVETPAPELARVEVTLWVSPSVMASTDEPVPVVARVEVTVTDMVRVDEPVPVVPRVEVTVESCEGSVKTTDAASQ